MWIPDKRYTELINTKGKLWGRHWCQVFFKWKTGELGTDCQKGNGDGASMCESMKGIWDGIYNFIISVKVRGVMMILNNWRY